MNVDFATIFGIVIGVSVVTFAVWSDADASIYYNLPGLLIVVGGTFASTLVKFPLSGVFIAFPVGLKAAFVNERDEPRDYISQALQISKLSRKFGIHTLEKVRVSNPFFKRGVQLVADGRDLPYIRKILTGDMARAIERQETGGRVFTAIGEAAPAFGMFGTLVGLVQMLASLDDPSKVGPSMAVAMLTTVYGVLIANLFALPIADKLQAKAAISRELRALIIECVFQIHKQSNPTEMIEILESYLPEKKRSSDKKSYTS